MMTHVQEIEESAEGTDQGFMAEPITTWANYVEAAEDLVHLTHEGLSFTTTVPEVYEALNFRRKQIERAAWKAARAQRQIDEGFSILHAHSLLGMCGAMECLIEDIVIASLRHDPSQLAGEKFKKLLLPVAVFVTGHLSDHFESIISDASRATGANLALGVAKYERMLELVSLQGCTPKAIRDALYQAQMIRNVWAHRAGIADAKFIERCPGLGFELGQRVNMPSDLFMHLFHGFHMYGMVIINRYRDSVGLPRDNTECHGYEGCLAEVP